MTEKTVIEIESSNGFQWSTRDWTPGDEVSVEIGPPEDQGMYRILKVAPTKITLEKCDG